MRREGLSHQRGEQVAASRPDRRTFLSLGVGCAVPLLIGGTMGSASGATAPFQGQTSTDPVMDHISQELMRVYHGMRGATGIRGEHVRTLAVNLDLLGAHLQGRKDDVRADAFLRRRIRDKGREATAQELMARYGDLAVGLSVQQGMAPRVKPDDNGAGATLDVLAAHGVIATLRGHKIGLHRLAAGIDRTMGARDAKAVPLAVRQKPGDDFLGYPPSSGANMTWCEFLNIVERAIAMDAAILGLIGFGQAAGILAVAAEVLDFVREAICDLAVAP